MTTADLPEPPIDAEVDLTDFSFMPLNVRQVRDSRFAASSDGDCFRSGVLLWCASWHQSPAGSLPDDDIELATLAGYGRMVKEWHKVKAGALYGWTRCSDGRLYHAIVVEKAKEAWQAKLEAAYRRELDRLRKENKRRSENKETALHVPSFDDWNSQRRAKVVPVDVHRNSGGSPSDAPTNSVNRRTDSVLKGQGRESKGIGTGIYPAESASGGKIPDDGATAGPADAAPQELALRTAYPAFSGRQDWLTGLHNARALLENGMASWDDLIAAVRRYALYCAAGGVSGSQFVMTPAKFFGAADRPWSQAWNIPATTDKRATEREQRLRTDAAELQALVEGRAVRGLLDFREPTEHEDATTYATALRNEEKQRRGRPAGDAGGVVSDLAANMRMAK